MEKIKTYRQDKMFRRAWRQLHPKHWDFHQKFNQGILLEHETYSGPYRLWIYCYKPLFENLYADFLRARYYYLYDRAHGETASQEVIDELVEFAKWEELKTKVTRTHARVVAYLGKEQVLNCRFELGPNGGHYKLQARAKSPQIFNQVLIGVSQ